MNEPFQPSAAFPTPEHLALFTAARRASDAAWDAASKLASQIVRNPDLPEAYKTIQHDSFEALRELNNALHPFNPKDGKFARATFVPTPPRNGPGFLEIGESEDGKMIVMNLPTDMTGHIVFSPAEARNLGEILIRRAYALSGVNALVIDGTHHPLDGGPRNDVL